MPTWIALFRGINVGGKNALPMTELAHEMKSLKLKNIKTYIQSGNVVFRSSAKASKELAAKISKKVLKRFGFAPHILVLGAPQLKLAIDSNPFPVAEREANTLHLFFLTSPPKAADIESLTQVKSASERFHLTDDVFYLHAPKGIGRSKLASKAEKLLGVGTTARNWRTVLKLREMAEAT